MPLLKRTMVRRKDSPYEVGPVRTDDLRAVLHLAWRTTSHLYPHIFFEKIAERQPEYFRVVRERATGRVLAFIMAARQPGTDANMLLLALDPGHKGQGLRRALLRDVQRVLREEGEHRFAVELPLADHELADLHRAEGFEVIGVERGRAPDEDRLVLAKPL